MRLGRDDKHIAEARELFEASQESDFFTLMRAYQFARNRGFSMEQCRRYGVHAQTARQVEQTYQQILEIAGKQGLIQRGESSDEGQSPKTESRKQKTGERSWITAKSAKSTKCFGLRGKGIDYEDDEDDSERRCFDASALPTSDLCPLSSVLSRQQIFDFYGELADTDAGRVMDGRRDRGGDAGQADLADAARP